MFKVGQDVVIKQSGQTAIVKAVHQGKHKGRPRYAVETMDGTWHEETDLQPADPAVLLTASGYERSRQEDVVKRTPEQIARDKRVYKLAFTITEALKEAKLAVDFHGHWRESLNPNDEFLVSYKSRISEDLRLWGDDISEEDLLALQEALASKSVLDRWVHLGTGYGRVPQQCGYCGQDEFTLETNGQVIRIGGPPCPIANGFPPNEWTLNVPSGKMVATNNLRPLFPLMGDAEKIPCVNTILGRRLTATAYAKIGLAHGSVSNSNPRVYKLPHNKEEYEQLLPAAVKFLEDSEVEALR